MWFTSDASPLRELTASPASDDAIRRLNRLYNVSNLTARVLLRSTSRDELFTEACRIAVEHGPFRMSWIGVVDEATRCVRPAASSGHVDGYLDNIYISIDNIAEGRGPVGCALRDNDHSIFNDLANDPAFAPWRDRATSRGYGAAAGFPLRVRGRIIGVYAVYSAEANWFGEEETRLLDALGEEISFALEILEREADRQRAEEKLGRERALTDALFDGMPGILYVLDDRGRLIRWNRQVEDVLGYSAEELHERSALALSDPDSAAAATTAIQAVFQNGRAEVELTFRTKRGAALQYFCTGVRIVVDHRPYLVGIGIDISQRRRAEEARRTTERVLAAIVESSEDAIFSLSLDGAVLSWNRGAERLYGYSFEEVAGEEVRHFSPGVRADDIMAMLQRVARGDQIEPYEATRQRKDGETVDVSVRVSPLKNSRGQIIGVSGIARDITERKRSEERLRRLNEEIEAQRLKIFKATMRTVEDIVNNFLSSLQLVRLEAEGRLSDEQLAFFDGIINGTAGELRALGSLETIRERTMEIGTGIEYRDSSRGRCSEAKSDT